MKFAVIIEKSDNGFGAYSPDLPGCIAADDTYEATLQLMKEAMDFHIEGMQIHGYAIPEPTSQITYIMAGVDPKNYIVIIEKKESNYTAYPADFLDIIVTAETAGEAVRLAKEALESHFRSLVENGESIPEPHSQDTTVELEFPIPAV